MTSAASIVVEASTPASCTYVVKLNEFVEVSRFDDGSVKYASRGFLVASTTSAAVTATAPAEHQ